MRACQPIAPASGDPLDIFVGNLPFTTTAEEVGDLFRAHGLVRDVRLVTDRDTGRSRGFAFVTMPNPAEGHRAIEALNDSLVNGRALRVNVAEDRPQRRGSGRPHRF